MDGVSNKNALNRQLWLDILMWGEPLTDVTKQSFQALPSGLIYISIWSSLYTDNEMFRVHYYDNVKPFRQVEVWDTYMEVI